MRPRWPASRSRRWMRARLLAWFKVNRRRFPWREPRYAAFGMLLAEMLLRQTRAPDVARVLPRLLDAYPDPASLARANRNRLLRIVRELGLQNQRMKALLQASTYIVEQHRGAVPRELDALRRIPHVGDYAAHAVACFAFGASVPVVDVNVLRVMARVFGVNQPSDLRRAPWVWDRMEALIPRNAREFNWAIFDLGAMVCSARDPDCPSCPWRAVCRYAQAGAGVSATSSTSAGASRTSSPASRAPRVGRLPERAGSSS